MKIGATGEGIRSSEEMAWDMDDLEIEVCKVKQPPCLSAIEVLGLTEVRQVLVICEYLNGERGAMEVVSPGVQGADDCEEFPVVDVVISFSGDERLGKVGAGVPIAIGVCLEEDGARGVL